MDSVDNLPRECKILQIDKNQQTFQFHYMGFNSKYDECIDFNSDRIVLDPNDPASKPKEAPKVKLNEPSDIKQVKSKEIIGSLLRKAGDISKEVLKAFQLGS